MLCLLLALFYGQSVRCSWTLFIRSCLLSFSFEYKCYDSQIENHLHFYLWMQQSPFCELLGISPGMRAYPLWRRYVEDNSVTTPVRSSTLPSHFTAADLRRPKQWRPFPLTAVYFPIRSLAVTSSHLRSLIYSIFFKNIQRWMETTHFVSLIIFTWELWILYFDIRKQCFISCSNKDDIFICIDDNQIVYSLFYSFVCVQVHVTRVAIPGFVLKLRQNCGWAACLCGY